MSIPNDMSNEAYVNSLPGISAEAAETCLQAMAAYGNNHWWLSNDPRTRAYYQLKEAIFLLPGGAAQFGNDLRTLFGRDIYPSEVWARGDVLLGEAEQFYREGTPERSDEQLATEAARAQMAAIEKFIRSGKPVTVIEVVEDRTN